VDIYLTVSDDDGKLLDDPIDAEVTSFINEYSSKHSHEIERPAVVLSNLRSLYLTYGAKIDRTESIADGIVTKYRIRQAMLLNIEQKLIHKEGKQWIEHYKATYDGKTLRSAQDYMALAKIPKIIPYAFLGKERVMEISRSIKALGIEGDDPMAAFIGLYNLVIDSRLLPMGSAGSDALAMKNSGHYGAGKSYPLFMSLLLYPKSAYHLISSGSEKSLYQIEGGRHCSPCHSPVPWCAGHGGRAPRALYRCRGFGAGRYKRHQAPENRRWWHCKHLPDRTGLSST
jgi:hypothetical protein